MGAAGGIEQVNLTNEQESSFADFCAVRVKILSKQYFVVLLIFSIKFFNISIFFVLSKD
jgi:hypothetical protein